MKIDRVCLRFCEKHRVETPIETMESVKTISGFKNLNSSSHNSFCNTSKAIFCCFEVDGREKCFTILFFSLSIDSFSSADLFRDRMIHSVCFITNNSQHNIKI